MSRKKRPNNDPFAGHAKARRGGAETTFRRRKVERLEDDTLGYSMLKDRPDDCLRAAMATVLQVEPREIPDPRILPRLAHGEDAEEITAQTWATFETWLRSRGLRMEFHEEVPVAADRWIGVVDAHVTSESVDATIELVQADGAFTSESIRGAARGMGRFSDHSLVMTHDRLLFDPAAAIGPPRGMAVRPWRPEDIAWGLTLDLIGGV